jgi:adenylate cyclase
MGYARATTLTAIGDAVNTASRLEALTKDYSAELIVSQTLAEHAGLATENYERHEVSLRGRDQPMPIIVVKRAADLPAGLAIDLPEDAKGAQKKSRGDIAKTSPQPAA